MNTDEKRVAVAHWIKRSSTGPSSNAKTAHTGVTNAGRAEARTDH